MASYFFLVFLVTILVTRIGLAYRPTPSPTIVGFRLHHWMYGVVLFALGFMLSNITLYAIGLGLFVDELTYLLIGGKAHEDNYSATSLVGTGLFVILIYLLRTELIAFI